jgi:hypothetical protein
MPRIFCADDDAALLCANGNLFDPGTVVSVWLRNNVTSGNISSVTDVLNNNPAVQAVDARRPAGATDLIMAFATNDVLVQPLDATNNGTERWGCAFWVDHTAAGAEETYFAITNLTGVASAMKVEVKKITTNFLRADLYMDASNARRVTATTEALGTVPAFVTCEYNSAQSGEENQIVLTVNGVVCTTNNTNLIGTPDISLGLAAGVTGNLAIGNRRDSTAASALTGRLSKNLWLFNTAMAGVTQGLLTPAARTALMNFEPMAA